MTRASAATPKVDPSELDAFPAGWKRPEFEIDRPGREYTAGAFHLLVSCNTTDHEPEPWHCSVFYRGDVDAVWTKGGFASAAAALQACVSQALRMVRETKDAVQRADKR